MSDLVIGDVFTSFYTNAVVLYSCTLQTMKATLTITSCGVVTLPARLRSTVTLPVEMYLPKREHEFDTAEADLAAVLAAKSTGKKRAPKPARKAVR